MIEPGEYGGDEGAAAYARLRGDVCADSVPEGGGVDCLE